MTNAAVPTDRDFLAQTPQQIKGQNLAGKRVRWGSEIVGIIPGTDKTCFEINSYTSDAAGRPIRDDPDTQGILIACNSGFHDSTVYPRGPLANKRAKVLGFSLKEIRELLALKTDPASTCSAVKSQAEVKLADINQRIASLQRMKQILTGLVTACHGVGPIRDCLILEALETEDIEW